MEVSAIGSLSVPLTSTSRIGTERSSRVHGPDGAPPYVVRWSDTGHEALFFPGPDSVIHHDESASTGG